MKVKHIAGVCGIATGALLVGGLVVSGNVFANVTYQNNTRVQFTFNPMLALTLSSDGFVIDSLMPGTSQKSNQVTATVATNSAAGYTLSATVGNSTTYNSTSLISGSDTIAMMSTGTSLAKGTWGYTLNDGTTYGALSRTESTILNKTINPTGTAADGYAGTATTNIKIGAYADDDQASGTYQNVMNFSLVANPASTYMQNLNPTLCTSTPTTVTDMRDGQDYTIARLEDGNCWLLENLRLDPTTVSLASLQGNTNAPNEVLGYLKNGGGDEPYAEYGVDDNPGYTDFKHPVVDTRDKNTVVSASGIAPAGKVGVYYNYCAASAGSYCSSDQTVVGNAQYDICPAGWKMPKGSTVVGSYDYLLRTGYSNNAANFTAALNTPLSGISGDPTGSMGVFWSSNDYIGNRVAMMSLIVDNSGATTGDMSRTDMISVRCILKDQNTSDPIDSITTMQQFGTMSSSAKNAVIEDMGTGQVYTLTDTRDNEQYKVAKLADYNVWLLDNLRLDPASVSLANLQGNTNAPNNVLAYFKNGGGSAPYPASGVSNEWDGAFALPYVDTSHKNYQTYPVFGNGSGKVGVYYNYCAATAGSYCYSDNAGGAGYIDYDICPVGWHIPAVSQYEGLTYLYPIPYGEQPDSLQYNLSTPLSGFNDGIIEGIDINGYFWSNQTYDARLVYHLKINGTQVIHNANNEPFGYRYNGIPVRCVLD